MFLKLNRTLIVLITFILALCSQSSVSQDFEGDMFYSVSLMTNPAFSGARGGNNLKLLYRDFYPGNNMNLSSLYLAYDTYVEAIQGGLGFYLSEDHSGDILNDLRTGASYAYHLRAGRELYVNAGIMTSLIYRRLNRSNIILPDQIDPILGPVLTTEDIIDLKSRLMFDIGVGFLFSYRSYNAGLSFNHISKPDLTGRNEEDGRLKRKMTIHADASFNTGLKDLKMTPLLFVNLQGGIVNGAAGTCVSYKPLTVSLLLHADFRQGINALQPGFTLKTGRFSFAYSYFFDAFANEAGIPSSHSNLISVSVSLNNVDNSSVMKAINYPNL